MERISSDEKGRYGKKSPRAKVERLLMALWNTMILEVKERWGRMSQGNEIGKPGHGSSWEVSKDKRLRRKDSTSLLWSVTQVPFGDLQDACKIRKEMLREGRKKRPD